MLKYVIGVIVLMLAASGGYYTWRHYENPLSVTEQEVQTVTTATFATSTFSLSYPQNYTVDTSYAYQGVPNKPIGGVKFTIPAELASGTNLSADSYISVESLPRAKKCTGDIYLYDDVTATEMAVGSTTFSVATFSGAGAGNRYEETVFAVLNSSPCLAVRYFIHYSALENYPEGTVRAFDKQALLQAFDTIRDSLIVK